MKIYFAGASTDTEDLVQAGVKRALTSYAEPSANRSRVLTSFSDVLIDSGAFTAFTQSRTISLRDYCQFIKQTGCQYYFNLDVIGDGQKTYENYCRLLDAGLNPIPVFHYGGDRRFLERYCESTSYVSLGGLVPMVRQHNKLKKWLDYCWALLRKYKSPKLIKVHGLGLTSTWALERYPWFSVDSTTWLIGNKFGEITDEKNRRIKKTDAINNIKRMNFLLPLQSC